MIFTSENNWYSWSYGNGLKFGRQQSNDKLQTHYEKFNGYVSWAFT